jgi:hypothetical protein
LFWVIGISITVAVVFADECLIMSSGGGVVLVSDWLERVFLWLLGWSL